MYIGEKSLKILCLEILVCQSSFSQSLHIDVNFRENVYTWRHCVKHVLFQHAIESCMPSLYTPLIALKQAISISNPLHKVHYKNREHDLGRRLLAFSYELYKFLIQRKTKLNSVVA